MVRAIPMAVSVLTGLTFVVTVGILPLKSALMGYSDTTTWLVVVAFMIAGAVIETGLGRRIALLCILILGRSITGLGYAICLAEFILGPVVPSNTARGGGILAPIVDSISRTLGSSPKNKPEKAGQYLHLVGAHANLITAAMFLTGMAANPLVSKAAFDIFEIQFDWFTWAKGGIVPGLIGLAGLPLLINYISTPTIHSIQPIRGKNSRRYSISWTMDSPGDYYRLHSWSDADSLVDQTLSWLGYHHGCFFGFSDHFTYSYFDMGSIGEKS